MLADPDDLLAKIDLEGPEGVTWFKPEEFEDDELAGLVKETIAAFTELEDLIDAIERRVNQLANEISPSDP